MAHIHDLIDFTVCIYIVYDSKVLFVFHPTYNLWLTIGGHIELDQDPEEALFAEIAEETGLEVEVLGTKPDFGLDIVKPLIAPAYMDIHNIANTHHRHIKMVYFGRAKSSNFKLSVEHTDFKWLSKEDIESNDQIRADDKFYALEALAKATTNS